MAQQVLRRWPLILSVVLLSAVALAFERKETPPQDEVKQVQAEEEPPSGEGGSRPSLRLVWRTGRNPQLKDGSLRVLRTEDAPSGQQTPPTKAAKPAPPRALAQQPAAATAPQAVPNKKAASGAAQAASPAVHDPVSKAKVDPIEANGPIFQRWPKPALTLVLSGLQQGYIEPCGCAGLENQKGGMARRHTFLKELAAKGWNPVPLDLGGLVRRYGRQQEIKYHSTVDGLKTMNYQGIGFGPDDLRLPGEIIFAAVAPVGEEQSPFVSANVKVFGAQTTPTYKIISAGGKKIGVTSILGADFQKGLNTDGIEFQPPEQALREVVPKLVAAKCDVLVLLSHAEPAESKALAKAFPAFDVVVTAGGADEPPAQATRLEGSKSLFIEVGHKGMYLSVLGFFDEKKVPVRYQRVPLDHRFQDSPQMKDLMTAYQDQLQELGLEGLGLRVAPHPSGQGFVGSQACADCHTKAFEVWSNTPHSHATETLAKLEIPRQYDPECLSCHTTGWEPQKYFPYKSGYLSMEATPLLDAQGCENCHGPGSAHVAAEIGDVTVTDAQLNALRKGMRAEKNESNCSACHDLDNSPDFVKDGGFEAYWPKVEHYGKD